MAADGSLRFETKIDTSDFDASISTLEKALDRLSNAVNKLSGNLMTAFQSAGNAAETTADKAQEAAQGIDTVAESAKEATKEAADLEKEMEKIQVHFEEDSKPVEIPERRIPVENPDSYGYDRSAIDFVENYGKETQEAQKHVNEFRQEISFLQSQMKQMEAHGMWFGDEEYDTAFLKISRVNQDLRDYKKELLSPTTNGGNIARDAQIASEEVVHLTQRLKELKARQSELENAGVGLGYQEYDSNVQEISSITERLGQYRRELVESETESNTFSGIVKNAFSAASGAIAKFAGSIGGKISSGVKLAAKNLKSLIKPADKASKSILKLSNMFKLMLIRMAMRGVIQGIKEGMQNLVQYSDDANRSVSSLMNGMTYLKNSFAAAFSPILSFVAPVLNTLIDLLATALGYINQFFSALGGSSTFVRAKKVNEDYAKSLKKTGSAADDAKKSLAGFDDLNVLNDQNSGSGGSSGSVDPSQMFETVTVDEAVSGFAEQIRSAFEAGNWKELGTLMGDKFNEAVDGIDWSGMGHKIGYGLNGAVQTAYWFLKTVDFHNIGQHVAELINGALEEVDTTFIGRTIVRWFTLKFDFILGLLGGLDWGLIARKVSDCIKGAFDEATEWLKGYDWSQMGKDLWNNIKEVVANIDWGGTATSIFTFLGTAIRSAFDFLGGFFGSVGADIKAWWDSEIQGQDWKETAGNLLNAIGHGFADIGGWVVENIVDPLCNALLGDDLWTDMKQAGSDMWAGFTQGITDFFNDPGGWIKDNIVDPFVNCVKDLFGIHSPSTVMAELGVYLIEGLMEGIKNFLPNLLNTLSKMIGEMKQKLSEIITYVSGAFKNGWEKAWNGVKDAFKGVFNGIISILESALNYIVDGINELSFDVPDWVPKVGGTTFGFDIQPFHLPRLASGTVVPPRAGEFAAILGDNNRETEVVSPLSTMKQAFLEAMREGGMDFGGGAIYLTVNLDGKAVYDTVVKRNQMTKKQTGKNPLMV